MKIFKQITAIMNDVDAIGKNNKNQAQNFNFRGIDDMYNYLHPLLSKHAVFTVPEVISERNERITTAKGTLMNWVCIEIKYHFYTDDGSNVVAKVIGEAMDSGDKAFNKAMSVAQKYAFIQVFSIPTKEDHDPDSYSHEIRPQASKQQNSFPPPKAPNDDFLCSEAQQRMLYTVALKEGLTPVDWKDFVQDLGYSSSKEIPANEVNNIKAKLESLD